MKRERERGERERERERENSDSRTSGAQWIARRPLKITKTRKFKILVSLKICLSEYKEVKL